MKKNNIETFNLQASADVDTKSGKIKGIANSLTKARNGIMVEPEAVKQSLGVTVPLLKSHDWKGDPVGMVTIESLDGDGLHYTGEIFETAPHRDQLLESIDAGVESVSVGLRVLEHDGKNITNAELLELSLTPVPADSGATVTTFSADDPEDDNNEDDSSTDLSDLVDAVHALTEAVKDLKPSDQEPADDKKSGNEKDDANTNNNNDKVTEALQKVYNKYKADFEYDDYRQIKNLLKEENSHD